uniref:Uncharacterized protein n=1 Tax=Lepeophtheirus salmonis TaxID=72036 RepID=A0A0K2SVL6_LEPSM
MNLVLLQHLRIIFLSVLKTKHKRLKTLKTIIWAGIYLFMWLDCLLI